MNTADRSVGHIDYAIRRRFAFITLEADKEAIEGYYIDLNISDALKGQALKLFDDIYNIIDEYISPDFD